METGGGWRAATGGRGGGGGEGDWNDGVLEGGGGGWGASRLLLDEGEGEAVRLRVTRSGDYRLRVWPAGASRSLLSSANYILTVTPGATFAPNCVLCYIAPFDGLVENETAVPTNPLSGDAAPDPMAEYRVGPTMRRNCTSFQLNQTAPFRRDASSTGNGSAAWTTDFPLCQQRICITLQVRRYDAWGNEIGPKGRDLYALQDGRPFDDEDPDIITTELFGIESAMFPTDPYGNGSVVYASTGSNLQYETWAHGENYAELGPVRCTAFLCPLIKLVGPDTFVRTWITVRLNGSPIGLGSPIFTQTVPGAFYNFLLDTSFINGSITPPGAPFEGPVIRALPADLSGISTADSFGLPCSPPRWPEQQYSSRVGRLSSYCRQQAMDALKFTNFTIKCFKDIGERTEGIASLPDSSRPGQTVEVKLLPLDNCTAAGCDSIKDTDPLPVPCEYCHWSDPKDQAFAYQVSTTMAALCVINAEYTPEPTRDVLPVQTRPFLRFFSPPSWSFAGAPLAAGQYSMRISAGVATPQRSGKEGAANESIIGTIAEGKTTLQTNVVLRDVYGNPNSDGATSFRAILKRKGAPDHTLGTPTFDIRTALWTVEANVTVSGPYVLQVLLAPTFEAMWGSPFPITVHPDLPIPANTVLISNEVSAVIGLPVQFFLQVRDRYLNLVSSVVSDYFSQGYFPQLSSSNRAPGFWIWAAPEQPVEDTQTGLVSEDPILDPTGTSFLQCPTQCAGEDPGFGSLKVAFIPQAAGFYNIKLQYCDPVINPGLKCFSQSPDAYDITKMAFPQPPNPCNDIPPGQPGSPRPGYACEIGDQVSFRLEGTTDRIIILQSSIEIPANMIVGEDYSIQVLSKDRLQRNAARNTSRCAFTISYFDVYAGNCIFNLTGRTFYVPFTPNVSGTYNISVQLDGDQLTEYGLGFVVAASRDNYDQDLSTAHGLGISVAAAGIVNTFQVRLRDKWGSHIRVGLAKPLLGDLYFEDCGYYYVDLPDGTPTSGYGLVGDDQFGIKTEPWGCRYSFHTYLVDSKGNIIRPAKGFAVPKIDPGVDGAVDVEYTIDEPGDMLMYVRYLPTQDAGQTFFNSSGRLSLESQSTSREGQIHGSPFRVRVHPSTAIAANSYATGPGIVSGVIDYDDWSRFDIVARDAFNSLAPCRGDQLDIEVKDPNGNALAGILVDDGTDLRTECRISYEATVTGIHELSIRLNDVVLPGSPFYPAFVLSAGKPSDSLSYARLIVPQSPYPCYESLTSPECPASSPAGSNMTVVVSALDTLGNLPDDMLSTFSVHLSGPGDFSITLTTLREVRGEHSAGFSPTRSGNYSVSVSMGASALAFMPSTFSSATVLVVPGPVHAGACSMHGSGMTLAVAGTSSLFRIVTRDEYGNSATPNPSPNPTEALPGRSAFQVALSGVDNTTVYGRVSDSGDGTFAVSYILTATAQYHMSVVLLDKPPEPRPTFTALKKLGVFQQDFRRDIPAPVGGTPVDIHSTQPWLVTVLPAPVGALPNSTDATCNSVCCGNGSFAYLRGSSRSDGVYAGQSFELSLDFADPCGNPSPASSNLAVRIDVYGPIPVLLVGDLLVGGAVRPFGIDVDALVADRVGFGQSSVASSSAAASASATLAGGELMWQAAATLTRSGAYAVKVSLGGHDVSGGLFRLDVKPQTEAKASHCVVRGLEKDWTHVADSQMIVCLADGFSFEVTAHDQYANAMVTPGSDFVSYIVPENMAADGAFSAKVTDLGNGKHNVEIPPLGVLGKHALSLLVGGEHVQGSPFEVYVVGGQMVPQLSEAVFGAFQSLAFPEQREAGAAVSTYADSLFQVSVIGRDAIGLNTREGVEGLAMSLTQQELGDLTPTVGQLAKTRTSALCLYANMTYLGNVSFHVLCDEDSTGNETEPLFSYEVQRDSTERASFEFEERAGFACKALSGYNAQETLWDNLVIVPRLTYVYTTVGNITTNRTEIIYEQRPGVILNGTQCAIECVRRNCSCATHVVNGTTSGDFSVPLKDGTCILMGKEFYLEEDDGSGKLQDYRAIFPSKVSRIRWYQDKSERPISSWAFARPVPTVGGPYQLSVTLGGTHIRGSPYTLYVEPGPNLSPNTSSLTLALDPHPIPPTLPPTTVGGPLPAIAGYNFTAVFSARDAYGNQLPFDSPWEQDVANAIATFTPESGSGGSLSGPMVLTSSSSFSIPFRPVAAGNFLPSFQISNMHLPSSSFPLISVLSASEFATGSSISASPSSCTSPCSLVVTLPADPYGNPSRVSCRFYILAADNTYVLQPQPSSSDAAGAGGVVLRTFTLTAKGSYTVRCDFTQTSSGASNILNIPSLVQVPGSPFAATVVPGAAVASMTLVTGPGLRGGVIMESVAMNISPKDAQGNTVACTASDVSIVFSPATPSITISDGSEGCPASYTLPSAAGDSNFTLTVSYSSQTIVSTVIQSLINSRPPSNGNVHCQLSGEWDVPTPQQISCNASVGETLRLQSPARLRLQLQWLDIDGVPADDYLGNVTLTIMRCAEPLSNATGVSSCLSPKETMVWLWNGQEEATRALENVTNTASSSMNNSNASATVEQLRWTRDTVEGGLVVDLNITQNGAYFVYISSVATTYNLTTPLLEQGNPDIDNPWVFHILPGPSCGNRTDVTGPGVERTRLAETSQVMLADKDSLGNLRVGQTTQFTASAQLVASGGTLEIPVSVTMLELCTVSNCIASGRYSLSYIIPAPEACGLAGGCGGSASLHLSIFREGVHAMTTIVPVDLVVAAYTPAFATAETPALVNIIAGTTYNLRVQPRNALGPTVPTYEHLFVVVQPEQEYNVQVDATSIFLTVSITASGSYSIRILDGLADIRGSPFSIVVAPAEVDSNNVVVSGPGAVTAFVGEKTTFGVSLRDRFGNFVSASRGRTVSDAFLSHTLGLQDIQTFSQLVTEGEQLSYTPQFPGEYSILITIDGEPAAGGLMQSSGQRLVGGRSTVTVIPFGNDPLKSLISSTTFTTGTAGVPMTFTIASKDRYGADRTVWGDVFFATLTYLDNNDVTQCSVVDTVYQLVQQRRDAPSGSGQEGVTQMSVGCMVGCSLPAPTYAVSCVATRSGAYTLKVTSGGHDLVGSPFPTMVHPSVLSHKTTKLLQVEPKLTWELIDLIQQSSTANLIDGSFLRRVGTNTIRIVSLDDYGNRAPAKGRPDGIGTQHVLRARLVRQVAVAQVSTKTFTLADEGADVVQGSNSTTGGSTSNVTTTVNGSSVVVVGGGNDANQEDQSLLPSFVPVTFGPVGGVEGGDYEITFTVTVAGKYRLHVYIDGMPIARHVPIEEMLAVSRAEVVSTPSCCVPLGELGKCPSAALTGQVCGDLITLLPGDLDTQVTLIVGNSTREFRFAEGGDGYGNTDYPVYDFTARDTYGNALTWSDNVFDVKIWRMNLTMVEDQTAKSFQPLDPDLVCRESTPSIWCGKFAYEWTGVAATISGQYRVDISYNGRVLGNEPLFQMIRSRISSIREALIFGPGLEVNVEAELTYFYFIPHDQYGNTWDPESIDSRQVGVDLGAPAQFGLAEGARLTLSEDTTASRSRLFYYGHGLFKAEVEPLLGFAGVFGAIQIWYGTATLAQERTGSNLEPITIAGPYEDGINALLSPVPLKCFATGSALYNHYAGDEVEVTAHSMSGESVFGDGTWPGVLEDPAKQFKVQVRGPAGVRSLNFRTTRSSRFRWNWYAQWTLTISGSYSVSVTYNGEHVQGDGFSNFKILPLSPYSIKVFSAPVDPMATRLVGSGLSVARVGEEATFELATRDIFGSWISFHSFDEYKGDAHANATLLGVEGPSVPVLVASLRNGRLRGTYTVTQAGTYALTVMINGISLTSPPLVVTVSHGFASAENSRWEIVHGGALAYTCQVDPVPPDYIAGVDNVPLPPPECPQSITAARSFIVRIDARDAINNTLSPDVEAPFTVMLEGMGQASGMVLRSTEFSRFEASLFATIAASYKVHVHLSSIPLEGSPTEVTVSAAGVYAPSCSMHGNGLHDTFIDEVVGVTVMARDVYGNRVDLKGVPFDAQVVGTDSANLPRPTASVSVTSTMLGMDRRFQYALTAPGTFAVSAWVMSGTSMELVPGSGTLVSSTWRRPPKVTNAVLNDALDGMVVNFEIATDMACSTGKTHSRCEDFQKSNPTGDGCCDYFAAESCASLGAGSTDFPAKCVWEDPSLIVITFGTGATVGPFDKLLLLPIIRSADGTSNPIKLPVFVDPPVLLISPTARVLSAVRVSSCDGVVLDASASSGGGGRQMAFTWAVDSGLQQDEALKLAIANAPKTSGVLSLPAGLVPPGTHRFIVSVENFVGLRGTSGTMVTVVTGPVLGIRSAESNVFTDRDDDVTLSVTVSTSSCFVFTGTSFQWALASGPPLVLDARSAVSTSLLIPEGTTVSGGVYNLSFTARGYSQGVLQESVVYVVVNVKRSPLEVIIAGGNSVASEGSRIVLDASPSYDPDQAPGVMHFYWSCKPVLRFDGAKTSGRGITSDAACFYDIEGVLFKDSSILTLTGTELSSTTAGLVCTECLGGVYNFTLNVTKDGFNGAEGRWSSASVIITIVAKDKSVQPVSSVVSEIGDRVSPSDIVRFEAAQISAIDPTELAYSWSVVNVDGHCCLGPLNMTRPEDFPTGLTATTLVVKPGELSPGIRYIFRFTTTHVPSGAISTADMFLAVNSPPKAGTFQVSPTSGIAGVTRFSMVCARWTDDLEDMPISYEFVATGIFNGRYASLVAPLATSTTGAADRVLPSVDSNRVVTITAIVADSNGAGVRVPNLVALDTPTGPPPSGVAAAAAANIVRNGPLAEAVALNQVNKAYENADIASSTLNFATEVSRRRLSSSEAQDMALIRESILSDLLGLSTTMAFNDHDLRAMTTSIRHLTHVPSQVTGNAILSVLALMDTLSAQALRFSYSQDYYTAACDTLSSVVNASRALAYRVPSPTSHKVSEAWTYSALNLLRAVARSTVVHRTPDDENLITLTDNFEVNTKRIRLARVLDGETFAITSTLKSQTPVTFPEGPSVFLLQTGFITVHPQWGNISYNTNDGSYRYGQQAYPNIVYSPRGYPVSVMPNAPAAINSLVFGPAPETLKEVLSIPYLDLQVTEWLIDPFDVAERGKADTNVASPKLGRTKSITCSSVLQDCSDTDNICTPPEVEGSQGPSYLDSACLSAFDGNVTTSWAVDPAQVPAGGAGSFVVIDLVEVSTVSAIQYQQRNGPRYCEGSEGYACKQSNETCNCVIGGDKVIALAFSDGSEQRVTLQPTYDLQYFEMTPVITTNITITVISVYSDSSTCPSRFECEWWFPTCNTACPNGAARIELLAVQSWHEVYDWGDGYMKNYSMRAAVVSRPVLVSLWQGPTEVPVYASEQPMLMNSTIDRHPYPLNNQTLAICRSWDESMSRWSSRGIVNSGRMAAAPSGFLVESAKHECASFFTSSYSIVLREYPIVFKLVTIANVTTDFLDMHGLYNFVVFVFFLLVFLAYIASSIWTFLRWLESWRVAAVATLQRRKAAREAAEKERLTGVRVVPKPAEPLPHQDYYAIVALMHSKVLASKAIHEAMLWKHHRYHCLCRWSYLYAVWSGGDDLPAYFRFTCYLILIISSFACNAFLLATGDTSTMEWYWAPLRCCCFTLAFAQLLPSLYRVVSAKHTGWDPKEVSDVYVTATAKVKPMFGQGGSEKRTRLKALRKRIGEAAISGMMPRESDENKDAHLNDYTEAAGVSWLDQRPVTAVEGNEHPASPMAESPLAVDDMRSTSPRTPSSKRKVLFEANAPIVGVQEVHTSGKGFGSPGKEKKLREPGRDDLGRPPRHPGNVKTNAWVVHGSAFGSRPDSPKGSSSSDEEAGATPRLGEINFAKLPPPPVGRLPPMDHPVRPRRTSILKPPADAPSSLVSRDTLFHSPTGQRLTLSHLDQSTEGNSPEKHNAPVLGSLNTSLQGYEADGSLFGARPTTIKAFIRAHAGDDKLIIGAARIKRSAKQARLEHEKAKKEAEEKAEVEKAAKIRQDRQVRAAAALEEKAGAIGSRPGSPDGVRTGAKGGARPGSRDVSRPGSPDGVRRGAKGGARPGSEDGARPGSKDGARPGSKGRPGSSRQTDGSSTSGSSRPTTTTGPPSAPSRPVTTPSRPGTRPQSRGSVGSASAGLDKRAASPSQLDIAWVTLLEAEKRREREVQERLGAFQKASANLGQESAEVEAAPPPPPEKKEEVPPSPPRGRPPRVLDRYKERKILRTLRDVKDRSETPFFRSRFRRWIYKRVFGRANYLWSVESRPQDEFFFPNWFYSLCYATQALALLFAFLILLIYSADFDDAISNAWIYSSISSIFVELCMTQPLLSYLNAYWLASDGRVWLITTISQWATSRTDLLPPFG